MRLLLLLCSCFLVACTNTTTKIQTIKVPDYYCPAPYIPKRPHLAIDTLTKSSTDIDIALAYGKTVDQLLIHSFRLENELKNYEKISKKSTKPEP